MWACLRISSRTTTMFFFWSSFPSLLRLCFLPLFGCLGSIKQNHQNASQIPLKFPFRSITYSSYLTGPSDLVISETLKWWWILTLERLIWCDDIWMSEVEILQILWPQNFIKYSEWPVDLKYSSHKWQLKRLCRYIYSDLRLKKGHQWRQPQTSWLWYEDMSTSIFLSLHTRKSYVMATSDFR